jgi:hypothetical protein
MAHDRITEPTRMTTVERAGTRRPVPRSYKFSTSADRSD